MIEITAAHQGEALEHVISLAHEYVAWMLAQIRARYPDLNLHEFASEHAYDDVRKKFPGEHVPPDGCLLVASSSAEICGCIGLGRLSQGIGEVRTLYVRPARRGEGVGRKLVEACLAEARILGYRVLRLDTLAFMTSAQNLYRSYGFYDIEPYLDLSATLKQHIRFFELKLSDQPPVC